MNLKVIVLILSLYLCNIILETNFLQVPDKNWIKKMCQPLEDGYEYNNIVIDKKGVSSNSYPIDCWYNCHYFQNCQLSLDQPYIYSFISQVLIAFIVGINIFIIFEM